MSFDIAVSYRAGESTRECTIRSDAGLVAITGPSGIGKTTLLNCIAGLGRPLAGHIHIGGATLFDASANIDVAPERRRAGYVFQDLRLFPHKTVAANLAYGQRGAAKPGRPKGGDALGLRAVFAMLQDRYLQR